MGAKDLANTHTKENSKGGRKCRVQGRPGGMGLIRKYGLNMKRQCFRERAAEMGWTKYSQAALVIRLTAAYCTLALFVSEAWTSGGVLRMKYAGFAACMGSNGGF